MSVYHDGGLQIRIGQVWERISDGTRVRITDYAAFWDDTSWREVDGKRKGQIYGSNLQRTYRLIATT